MINIAKLKAKIEARIAEMRAEHETRLAEWEEHVQEDKREWLSKYKPTWEKAADAISTAVCNYEVVTRDMYPGSCWSEPYSDKLGRGKPDKTFRPPTELVQVLNALEMFDEPEISHTALRQVGIMPADMNAVSKCLARGAR